MISHDEEQRVGVHLHVSVPCAEGRFCSVKVIARCVDRQGRQSNLGKKVHLPGVFRCAGLMVPDPSIMVPPMPFMEVVTGWVVEYMATDSGTAAGGGGQRPLDGRKRLSPQLQLAGGRRTADEPVAQVDRTSVSMTGNGALGVACRPGESAND